MKAKRKRRNGLAARKTKVADTRSDKLKDPDPDDSPPSRAPDAKWGMLTLSVGMYLIWLLYLAYVAVWG